MSVIENGETEIIDLGEASTGWGEAETFNCDPQNVFKVTQPTYGRETWEGKKWVRSASKIKFKLADNCTKTKGRVECDIEIASGEI
ncbi:hypothetical protein DNK47_00805 [Mycoplasma wenyonii]|uniref:Uncharacterized protein n=1 Tax=Mycoplasma wenyonii TaxID=65123 RepID=A0A328PL92_9MOLU|nr:hypothetical protein [Mycoplasma wenyonii]RAO95154.1 hypothetical protein DNK47_00805 [Mycoplasma wenyonii]